MDSESKTSNDPLPLSEADLADASLESLVLRYHTARRNAVLARARVDYQEANNTHREAVHYERLIAASERMPQAERKAIVESNSDVMKGRQQAIVLAKEAALWAAEAATLRLYISAKARLSLAGEGDENAGSAMGREDS